MRTVLKYYTLSLFIVAAMFLAAGQAGAQTGQDPKAEKKMLVKVMSIENGDTTITEHQVDPNDPDVSWVEKDDDGKEVKVRIRKDHDDAGEQHTGMACCEAKDGAGKKEGADKKECAGKDCCAMDKDGHHDKAAMEKMHGKMDSKEMKEMHGKMSSKEMKEMHEKMSSKEMKEMHKQMMKEKKEKDDDDEGEKEDDDDDDDDGVNIL